MSHKTAIERLRDAGLFVEFEEPEYTQRRLFNLLDGKEVPYIRYCMIHNASPIFGNTTSLDFHENTIKEPYLNVLLLLTERAWEISVIEGHGGLVESDFVCKYSQFEEIVETAIRYYFGSPTVINDWAVPLHKHPELNMTKVKDAVENAVALSAEKFKEVRRQLRQTVEEKRLEDDWEIALEQGFIFVPHEVNKSTVCALRRNAQQAYIIPNKQ